MARKKTKNDKVKNKKILVIILLLVLVIFVVLFSNKTYTYNDGYAPSTTYKIRINKITRVVHAKVYDGCSYVNCTTNTYKYSVKLTKDEYKKVKKLWSDKEHLSLALFYLRDVDEIRYKSYNEYKNENYYEGDDEYDDVTELNYYNEMDTNSDGKITMREFANQYFNDIINEKD